MKTTMARLALSWVSGLAVMALVAVPPVGAESFYKGKRPSSLPSAARPAAATIPMAA